MCTKLLIAPGGDEDDRNFQAMTAQFVLQLRPRHAGHRHVQYQTLSIGGSVGRQIVFSGSKCHGSESEHPQKIGQGFA